MRWIEAEPPRRPGDRPERQATLATRIGSRDLPLGIQPQLRCPSMLRLALLVAVAVTACTAIPAPSVSPTPTSQAVRPDVAPQESTSAPQESTFAPPITPLPSVLDSGAACAPNQVTLAPGASGVGLGTSYLAIDLNLIATQPCRWPMWPAIMLRDATGHGVASGAREGEQTVPLSAPLTLEFGWASWCFAPPAPPLTLAIVLDAGHEATMTIPAGFGASCMDVPTTISLQIPGL